MINRYALAEMSAHWGDARRYEIWLQVELSVCEAMEGLGQVPRGTAEKVRGIVQLDADEILSIEARVKHDVIAFLTFVEGQVPEAARWLHLGLTSSDVLDTAFAIQLRDAGQMLMMKLDRLMAVVRQKALDTKDLPTVARTHGIHAEPTSLGVIFAGFYAELRRQKSRLIAAIDAVSVGKIAGAVGVYGNVDPQVEAIALPKLGLRIEPCATQVVPRDRHALYFSTLALIASSIERLALQIRHWQRTEVGEAVEPFGSGQKGSSAMPHKKNPILTENLCGLARLMRGYVSPVLESVALWHERDISHSAVERVVAPDATILLDFMLHRMTMVMDGLVINHERIAENLSHTAGLIFSEAVLLALVRSGLGRQKAYEMVQRHALAALSGGGEFFALLQQDKEILQHVSAQEIARCFDITHHLRHVDRIFARVFDEAQEC